MKPTRKPTAPAVDLGALQSALAKATHAHATTSAELERAHAAHGRTKDRLDSARAQFDEGFRAVRGA